MYGVTVMLVTLAAMTSVMVCDVVSPEVAIACHTHQQDIATALSPDQRIAALRDIITTVFSRDDDVRAYSESRGLSVTDDWQMSKLTQGLYVMVDMAGRQSPVLQSVLPFFRSHTASAPSNSDDVILQAYLDILPRHVTSYNVPQAQLCISAFLRLLFAAD